LVEKWHIVAVPEPGGRQIENSDDAENSGVSAFSERPAWRAIGEGWRHLHGSVAHAGASFEWHDFKTSGGEFDWGKTFHPGSVEVCLNLEGSGKVALNKNEIVFTPLTAGFYRRGEQPLRAAREANQRHQFLTVEMSFEFLRRHLGEFVTSLHPLVREVVAGQPEKSAVAPPLRLTSRQQQLLASLRDAPVLALAQPVWYQAKALEVAAEFFFVAPGEKELFCQRQQRLSAERVEKVIALLREKLDGNRHDDSAIHAAIADGARGGIAPIRQVQRHRGRAGGGLFELESFQPGLPRDVRLLSRTLSAENADAKDFAQAAGMTFRL
jgi:hypothetical protein